MRAGVEERQAWTQCLWVAACFALTSGGLLALVEFDAPGDRGASPGHWPPEAPWTTNDDQKSLLLFAHPHCPCTKAALGELSVVREQLGADCTVRVVFLRPRAASADWSQNAIVAQAEKLTGVEVVWDEGGRAAALFGAKTSGHTFLYDEDGRLRFSGGITAARGQEGENPGRDALIELGSKGSAAIGRTPVLGCSLSLRGEGV